MAVRTTTIDPARDWALRCLSEFEAEGTPLERLFERCPGALDSRDRRFARQLILGTLRWRQRIDWILDRFARKPMATTEAQLRQVLRLGTYQIIWLDGVPNHAAVNGAVEQARRYGRNGLTGFVNAILRQISRHGAETALPGRATPGKYLSVRHSQPQWLVEKWLAQRGSEATRKMLTAMDEPGDLYLRANRMQTSASDLADLLRREGRTVIEAGRLPGFAAVTPADGLFDSPAFADGLFQIQDVNAALPVALLAPAPGERILDLCAAPGGKATQIAEQMDDDGLVVAADRIPARLRIVRANAARLRLGCLKTVACDARFPACRRGTEMAAGFDRVLADVPCSGTGILGRHPEHRWEKSPARLHELVELQYQILQTGFAQLRPGGVLVYSTCSLEPEENIQVIEAFLAADDAAELEPASQILPSVAAADYLEIVPGPLPGDGVFAARIRKLR